MSGPAQAASHRTGMRRAATVLVLRPVPGGATVEVLLVRRNRQASFMADAYVFPGGRVEEADGEGDLALAGRRAAARELHEEVGLRLDERETRALPLFSHWITPSVEPKRFDTDFFLAALPPGQEPRTDEAEVFDLLWLTPQEALYRYERAELKLPPPTRANLEDLQQEIQAVVRDGGAADLVAALLSRSARRQPVAVLPKLVCAEAIDIGVRDPTGGPAIAIVLPWDPEFSRLPGEGEVLPAPGLPGQRPRASRYLLTEGRWWAQYAGDAPLEGQDG